MPRVNDLLSNNISRAIQNQITWSIFYNVKEEGAIGNGAIDDFPAINHLINTKIQGNALVIFPKGEYLIRSNMVVPENVFLYFVGEGLLKPDAGVTITINGGIIAGAYPIFVGDGNTNGSNPITEKIFPQWWGAKGDGVRDDTVAISKTAAMAPDGAVIWFLNGEYLISDQSVMTPPTGVRYIGDGWAAKFRYNNQDYPIVSYGSFANVQPNKVVISDNNGNVTTSNIDPSELNNLTGLTNNVQSHITNSVIHVTAGDKTNWNSKAPGSVVGDLQVVKNTADTALSNASTAQSTANTATQKANTAQTAADNAQTTADTAVTKANAAQSSANAAQSTATTGVTKADAAQSTANQAVTDASNAQDAADTAQDTIDTHAANSVVHVTQGEHDKLAGIQAGAQVNQNSFAVIKVGGQSDILADIASSILTVAGGLGISVSTNAANRTLTITATGDTAPAAHASTHLTGGSDAIPVATISADGLMSAADVQKIADAITAISGLDTDVDALQTAISAVQDNLDTVSSNLNTHTAATSAHGATATPTANRIAMYDANGRLQSGAAPVGNTDVVRKVELDAVNTEMAAVKQSVSDGKSKVAGAITDKGVPTPADATFQTMADNIDSIVTDPSGDATATAADLLSGKTAYSQYQKITGTMPNRTGHVTGQSISRSGTTLRIRPQAGRYPADTANSVQWSDPNWIAENIREGKSIFGLAGTMPYNVMAEGQADAVLHPTAISSYYYWVLQVRGLSFEPDWVLYQDWGNYHTGGLFRRGNLPTSGIYGTYTSYTVSSTMESIIVMKGTTADSYIPFNDGFNVPVRRRTNTTGSANVKWIAGLYT